MVSEFALARPSLLIKTDQIETSICNRVGFILSIVFTILGKGENTAENAYLTEARDTTTFGVVSG